MIEERKFYLYVHRRVNTDVIYVGIGQGDRAWSSDRTHPVHARWCRFRQSCGDVSHVEVVDIFLTEAEARRQEQQLIDALEKQGCKLFNIQHSKYRRTT